MFLAVPTGNFFLIKDLIIIFKVSFLFLCKILYHQVLMNLIMTTMDFRFLKERYFSLQQYYFEPFEATFSIRTKPFQNFQLLMLFTMFLFEFFVGFKLSIYYVLEFEICSHTFSSNQH